MSAPVGSGLTVNSSDMLLNHDNSIIAGFDEKAANSGTWNANGNFWDAYYTYPPGHTSCYSSEANATIEFSVQDQNGHNEQFTVAYGGICRYLWPRSYDRAVYVVEAHRYLSGWRYRIYAR